MKRLLTYCVDYAAIYAVVYLVYAAHGLAWSIVGGVGVMAYGIYCFCDGQSRA